MKLPIRIDARDDPRVDDFQSVAEPDLVLAKGLFVAEGRLVVRRLLEDRRFPVRSLLLSDTAFAALEDALDLLDPAVPVYVSSPQTLGSVAGFNVHRGCLALVERPQPRPIGSLLRDGRLAVIPEGVGDPSNLGAIFRNALAFGAGAVLLSPTCCDPLYRKAVRTSMAATLRVPFARIGSWPDGLSVVRAAGFTVVALTPEPSATPLEALVAAGVPARVALLIGTEGDGLTDGAMASADVRIRIPVRPEADSVNVAVAVGIALYRLTSGGSTERGGVERSPGLY